MYLLTQDGTQIVASEHVERFCITKKPEDDLIVASYSDDRKPITLARYAKSEDAKGILFDLFVAMDCGETSHRMPPSILQGADRRVHDARIKRKGGS